MRIERSGRVSEIGCDREREKRIEISNVYVIGN